MAKPRMRLVCFTNAGNEENIYTNEGLGVRRVPQLLDWCRANKVEMLAPQLPGRGMRVKEPFLGDAQVRPGRCDARWSPHTPITDGGIAGAGAVGAIALRCALLRGGALRGDLDCVRDAVAGARTRPSFARQGLLLLLSLAQHPYERAPVEGAQASMHAALRLTDPPPSGAARPERRRIQGGMPRLGRQ